jgi:signal transduction histidine kinase
MPKIHQRILDIEDIVDNDLGLKSLVLMKLSSSQKIVGVMLIGFQQDARSISKNDLDLISRLGDSIGVAVESKLLFEENQLVVDQLQKANSKLKELDEAKDDFISMASHQLRTPLTSVKGYISMVQDGDAGKITNQQKEMLGQAFFSSQRMVYLIADLLNVSRLKTGKFVIESTPVNLAEIVSQEVGQLVETASAKDLKLSYDKPKEFPTLMIDETKTRQVIMNFVDNAIYYTPAGGEIAVRLIDNEKTIELRVVDNGIGVPKAEQHHLFTKFYRAGNARKARPDGTGLGLFMAKKVIAAEGGSIIFESTEGKGSTFGFVFSKSKLAVKPGAILAKAKEAAPSGVAV